MNYPTEFITDDLLHRFYTKDNIVFQAKRAEDLNACDQDELDEFHAQAVTMVILDDDYLCGMRADHFVVELGYSENDDYTDDWKPTHVYFLVSANHKGMRMTTLFRVAHATYFKYT